MDERAAIADDRRVITVLLFLAASSGGPATRDIVGNSVCVPNNTQMAEGYKQFDAGRIAESQATFQAALDAVEQRDSSDSVTRACLMNMIGYAEIQQVRPDLAEGWFQRGLALKPLPVPVTALLTINLAVAYLEMNELDRAEETARRASRLAMDAFGAEHPEALVPLGTLAGVYMSRGDLTRAEPIYRRVHYQWERAWGASSYQASKAAGRLAMIYLLQRKFAQAQAHFEKSLTGLQGSPMRAKGEIPLTQVILAWSHAASGRTREANTWLDRALVSAAQDLRPEDATFSTILEGAAKVRFILKDYDSGRQLFDRAIEFLEARHGPGSQLTLDALERYAELLRAAKDKTRSKLLDQRRKALRP